MAGVDVQRPVRGVLLVTGAVFVFALADVATKHLAMRYDVPFVVAIRYFINVVLLLAVLAPRHELALVRTTRTRMVVLRGLCLAAASLTMGIALRHMPVGETVAIIYLAPVLVLLLSVPLLGERVGRAEWIGALVGFAGVLVIVRPGSGLSPVGVGFALANACLAAGYVLLSRVLARTETMIAMLFYTAVVGALVFGAMLPWSLNGPAVTWADAGLLLALGVLATVGHFLFTAAYREAPASVLAPVNYMHLAWAALLGWLVFSPAPDGWSLLGMAMVAGAGVAIAVRSGRRRG